MNTELIKLSAAAILLKEAAPDFISKLLGKPTKNQIKRLELIKAILPIAGTIGIGIMGMSGRSKPKPAEDTFKQLQDIVKDPSLQGLLTLALSSMPQSGGANE